ncbi:hypothetical protein GCM10009416_47290 [Craurococcus roseus]|uniref:CHAT domain-containing protein n=1 Tax=Craurococcus roseus TaxID=77585 RepID=A0ABN1G5T5_9PROT
MTLYMVSSDEAVQDSVSITLEDFIEKGSPLRELRPHSANDARDRLATRDPPSAVILDKEAPGAEELLDWIAKKVPTVPVVLPIRAPELSHIAAVLRPRVWGWDMSADPDDPDAAEKRLAAVLGAAVAPPAKRRLLAVVRFTGPAAQLAVVENGISHFSGLPLLVDGWKRDKLNRLAQENLEPFREGRLRELKTLWAEFSERGIDVMNYLFDSAAADLIDRSDVDSLEFRFEIEDEALEARFGLPLELLCKELGTDFLCKLRPMARGIVKARKASPAVLAVGPAANANAPAAPRRPPPLVLFVDASMVVGQPAVFSAEGVVFPSFDELRETAAEQLNGLRDLEQKKRGSPELPLCRIEIFPPPGFKIGETKYAAALEERLRAPADKLPRPDILHFCGHGITTTHLKSRKTQLILPGTDGADPDPLPVDLLAGWLPEGLRLIFLAACQSVSPHAARALHHRLQCDLIGFRWTIDATKIADFTRNFYAAHLDDGLTTAAAYQRACESSYRDTHTAWVSAVALAAA